MKKVILFSLILLLMSGCKSDSIEKKKESQILEYMDEVFIDSDIQVYSDITDLKIQYQGKAMELKSGLRSKNIKISELLQNLDFVTSANDGGSKLYKSTDTIKYDQDFFVAQCRTLNGNNNILFSSKENVVEFCKYK